MVLLTKNGHDLRQVVSCLQKAIRRNDLELAGYCANEMFGRYNRYLWRRLLVIGAEDCNDCINKELLALMQSEDIANKDRKGYDRETVFVAKAIVLMCKGRHNRDADYFCCNFMESEEPILDLDSCEFKGFPEYVFDCRTPQGRKNGKDIGTFIEDEERDLANNERGIFTDEPWDRFMQHKGHGLNKEKGFPFPTKEEVKKLEDEQLELF